MKASSPRLFPHRRPSGWRDIVRPATAACFALAAVVSSSAPAHAVTINWVTVGDPGNIGETQTYSNGGTLTLGAVDQSFRIMKYEWTNQQYADFLNAVDPNGTNPNSIYKNYAGLGGISFTSGNSAGSKYAIKTNMGDKPVNMVTWFDAARVANWLHNGQGSGSTETGAYTLNNATSGNTPAVNTGALFYIPTESQWYKAAYYKGGGTNAGYWDYATQSDTAPTAVTSGSTGIGSAGSTGNFANYNGAADWNGRDGNLTTVGTNGGSGAYGTFDMSGNLYEWIDLSGAAGSSRVLRGGSFNNTAVPLSSSFRALEVDVGVALIGFRLASPVAVPEPSTWVMGLAGMACGGWQLLRRRKYSPWLRLLTAAAAAVVLVVVGAQLACAQAVAIDWVTVGNARNAADTSPRGYGAVAYEYRIGKYEITIGQYAGFLNAVAKSDPYSGFPPYTNLYGNSFPLGLWNPSMETDLNSAGIARSGTEGSYSYTVIGPSGSTPTGADSPGNRPITYVSWFDAARYANWLHNGQGSGSTETGAYTLNGAVFGTPPAKNPDARFWIPTEDEWYKAAYYKGSGTNAGYWDYAMRTDATVFVTQPPGNTIGSGSNQANYKGPNGDTYAVTQSKTYSASQNYLTNVGAFSNNASAYGTFDQSGNVAEWTDGAGQDGPSTRRYRGGSWGGEDTMMDANTRPTDSTIAEYGFLGFRLASVTPTVVSGSQVYSSPVSGVLTTGSGAAPQFTAGFTGSLIVTGGTATLGGPIAGTVTVAAGAATTIASGANLTNAKVSLEPGATLSVAQGISVPIAAGNIGGLSIRSSAQLGATVLSGSVAADTTIIGTFSNIGNFSATGSDKIVGKVLSFEGTGNATWALQMTYDPSSWLEDETSLLADGKLFLSWRNPATNAWVNAVDGNTGGTKQFFSRAWQLGDTLGSYGVDLSNNAMWAVVNHNSDFAVTAITSVIVPEPSTYGLAVAGMTCIGWRVIRRRKS